MEEPQTETVNPLHVMEDDELVSRVCIEYRGMMDSVSDMSRFKELRQELIYRLRLSHMENWTPPRRVSRSSGDTKAGELGSQ